MYKFIINSNGMFQSNGEEMMIEKVGEGARRVGFPVIKGQKIKSFPVIFSRSRYLGSIRCSDGRSKK